MASRVKSGQAKCLFCGKLHPIRQPCRNRECVAYIPTAAEARRIEEAKQDKNASVATIASTEEQLMTLQDDGEQD